MQRNFHGSAALPRLAFTSLSAVVRLYPPLQKTAWNNRKASGSPGKIALTRLKACSGAGIGESPSLQPRYRRTSTHSVRSLKVLTAVSPARGVRHTNLL